MGVTPTDFEDNTVAEKHFGPRWDCLICCHAVCSLRNAGDGAGLLWGNTFLQMPSLLVALASTRKMDAGLNLLALMNLAAVAFVDYGDTVMLRRAIEAGAWCVQQNVT